MQIRGEGLMDEDGEDGEREEHVVYVLHPNCAVEEV
jgi:DNA replication licensing factor MCM6